MLEPSQSDPQNILQRLRMEEKRKFKNLQQTVSTVGIIGRTRPYWNDTMSFQDKKDLLKIETEKLMEDAKSKTSVAVEDELEKLVSDISFSELKEEIESLQCRKKEILEPSPSDPPKQNMHQQLRIEEKRKYKNPKQVVSTVGINGPTGPYWNDTMSFQDKKDLLKIEIEKLTEHLDGKKLSMAKEVLMEAVDFAKTWRSWKFYECCCCGDKFPKCESIINHINNAHLKIPLHQELLSLVPEMVSKVITSTIELDSSWKPVDSISAAKISENLSSEELKSVEWPYCDDSNRAAVINSIREWLGCFISCKCFAPSLLEVLVKFAISSLKARSYPIQEPLEVFSSRPLFLICFLEVAELSTILDFLENLAGTCRIFSIRVIADHGSGERIVFSSDWSCLLFDERYLRGEIGEPDDDGCAVNSSDRGDNEEAEVTSSAAHSDDFLSWLWIGGPTIEEKMKEWTSRREAWKSRKMVVFEILQREFGMLKQVCQRKLTIVNYGNPLLNLSKICDEEKETREKISGYEPKSYHSLLLNRKQVLEMDSNGFEFQMIESILKGAQTDTDIQEEIKNKIDRMYIGLLRVDAIILLTNDSIRQTGLNLVCDYRSVLVSLLKSHMQECLQNQVYEDALKKSLAAEKDLLADLDLDADKNTNKGHGHGKSKRKKKKGFYRKAQDFKATGGAKEQHPPYKQLYMEEIDVPVSSDDLKPQEGEQLMRQAEEYSRKLYENLECQRKVEDEAKRLAEQNKCTGEASAKNFAAASFEEDDGGSSEQQACLSAGHEENYPKGLDDEKAEEMQRKLNELKKELRHEAEEEQRKLDKLKQRREAEEEHWKLDELKQQREAEEQRKKLDALKQLEKELRREAEEEQKKLDELKQQREAEEQQKKLDALKQQEKELRREAEEEQKKLDELKQRREAEEEQRRLDELKQRREAEEQQKKLDALKQKKLDALKQQEIELRREVEDGQRKVEEGQRRVEEGQRRVEEERSKVEEEQRKVEEEQRKVEDRQRKLSDVLKLQIKIENECVVL